VLLGTLPLRAADPFVKDLTLSFKGKDLAVSLAVSGALDPPEIKELINSTRTFDLTFTVDVIKQRAAWADKIERRSMVVHTVRFDNLARQYVLETTLNGQKTDKRRVATWEEMEAYMVRVSDLTFPGVADLNLSSGEYAVRTRVHVQTQFLVVIFPYEVQTPWVIRTLAPPP
jgi:hypothetical protein